MTFRNPSVIESKLKSELNLKRISSEATGKNGEKITELFLPEYFHIVVLFAHKSRPVCGVRSRLKHRGR